MISPNEMWTAGISPRSVRECLEVAGSGRRGVSDARPRDGQDEGSQAGMHATSNAREAPVRLAAAAVARPNHAAAALKSRFEASRSASRDRHLEVPGVHHHGAVRRAIESLDELQEL